MGYFRDVLSMVLKKVNLKACWHRNDRTGLNWTIVLSMVITVVSVSFKFVAVMRKGLNTKSSHISIKICPTMTMASIYCLHNILWRICECITTDIWDERIDRGGDCWPRNEHQSVMDETIPAGFTYWRNHRQQRPDTQVQQLRPHRRQRYAAASELFDKSRAGARMADRGEAKCKMRTPSTAVDGVNENALLKSS